MSDMPMSYKEVALLPYPRRVPHGKMKLGPLSIEILSLIFGNSGRVTSHAEDRMVRDMSNTHKGVRSKMPPLLVCYQGKFEVFKSYEESWRPRLNFSKEGDGKLRAFWPPGVLGRILKVDDSAVREWMQNWIEHPDFKKLCPMYAGMSVDEVLQLFIPYVSFSEEAREALKRYECEDGSKYVKPPHKGYVVSAEGVGFFFLCYNEWGDRVREGNLLRESAASWFLIDRVPLMVVKDDLDLSDVVMTPPSKSVGLTRPTPVVLVSTVSRGSNGSHPPKVVPSSGENILEVLDDLESAPQVMDVRDLGLDRPLEAIRTERLAAESKAQEAGEAEEASRKRRLAAKALAEKLLKEEEVVLKRAQRGVYRAASIAHVVVGDEGDLREITLKLFDGKTVRYGVSLLA